MIFRILSDWDIRLIPDADCTDKVIIRQSRVARICRPSGDACPRDYVLHELLHIALTELRYSTPEDRGVKEEILIQDICGLVYGDYKTLLQDEATWLIEP